MENNFENEISKFIQKIKHYLIVNFGKVESISSNEEFYLAFSYALREKIIVNWTATKYSIDESSAKKVYFICLEYLPGKFLSNNITNLNKLEIVKAVLNRMDRNLIEMIKLDVDPGLGNGGLGRLASCYLDSLTTQKYPSFGYGLRYQYGIFEQEIWNGVQIEKPDCWLLNEFPWEFRKDADARFVKYSGNIKPATNRYGDEVYSLEDFQEIRALPFDIPIVGYPDKNQKYNVSTLRLWSTKDSPRNFELQRYNAGQIGEASENSSLTDVLYPNDNNEVGKRIRLKQEFLLVSASIQDIIDHNIKIYGEVTNLPGKIQIQLNDTHPALAIVELIRIFITNHDLSYKKAFELTSQICNFTNHTILKESLEEWNEERVKTLLPRQYKIIEKLNYDFCSQIRAKYLNDEERVRRMSIIQDGQIKMAFLAIIGCNKVNGVAYLHTEILKNKIFKDFHEFYPEKFINITNGITQRRWLLECNLKLSEFLDNRIGENWRRDFSEIKKLKEFAKDKKTLEELRKIKQSNKLKLFEYIKKNNFIRDYKGKILSHYPVFDDLNVLVDVQIKRFHEYKRQLMNALHLLMLYNDLKNDINSRKVKRFVLMGGKAAPGYKTAKSVVLLFYLIAKKINSDPDINSKLKACLIENYNVSKAEIIIPAADLSEQISIAGYEASGTGNMKLSINGALTIGTEDGANIEMREEVTDQYWPFSFGLKKEEVEKILEDRSYRPKDIYENNEKIKNALNMLSNGSLTSNEFEKNSLNELYNFILFSTDNDKFFVLKDLQSFYDTQKKVEDLYIDPDKWNEYVIHNIGSMGKFSSDRSIEEYSNLIWNLKKCDLNEIIYERVKNDYFESSL